MSENVKNNKSEGFGLLMVIIAGCSWGVISIFIRKLTSFGYDSLQISCFRGIFSVIGLSVFFIIKDKSLFKISIKDIWMFIGTGIISLTFFSYCYFTTIVSSGAAVAVVLLYTSPVFVMLLSAVFFKEKITLKKIIGLLLTISGCVFVAGLIGFGSGVSKKSFLIGIGAGLGYAFYSLFAGFATRKYTALTITFYTLLFSGISLLLLCKPSEIISMFELRQLPWMLGISLICTVIPYITYTIGLSLMEAGKAAILVTVEPLVGCLLGIFAWKEEINFIKVLGIILIFASILLLSINKKKKE